MGVSSNFLVCVLILKKNIFSFFQGLEVQAPKEENIQYPPGQDWKQLPVLQGGALHSLPYKCDDTVARHWSWVSSRYCLVLCNKF